MKEPRFKKTGTAPLAAALREREHRVVRHSETVGAVHLLGDLPETPARVQQGEDLIG